jgi:hypothetical protein
LAAKVLLSATMSSGDDERVIVTIDVVPPGAARPAG